MRVDRTSSEQQLLLGRYRVAAIPLIDKATLALVSMRNTDTLALTVKRLPLERDETRNRLLR
jgi:hypothetical protein